MPHSQAGAWERGAEVIFTEILTGNRRERVDYSEVMNEQDFALYAELCSLRKLMAKY